MKYESTALYDDLHVVTGVPLSYCRFLLQRADRAVWNSTSDVYGVMRLLPRTVLQFPCAKHLGVIYNIWTFVWYFIFSFCVNNYYCM